MPFNTLYTLYIKCKTVDSFLRIKQTLEFHMTWSVRKLSKHELHFLFQNITFLLHCCMHDKFINRRTLLSKYMCYTFTLYDVLYTILLNKKYI